jgi:hypothetical protein
MVLLALILAMALWNLDRPEQETRSTPLPNQAYIWQRQWRADVGEAIRDSANDMEAYCLLAAEMRWTDDAPQIRRITPDWGELKNLARPPGVVVRIFPSVATTGWNAAAVNALAEWLDKIEAEFTANGVPPGEVQLDYDCPESKLDDYLRLVSELKRRQPARVLTITALPAWLRHVEFAALARAAPGYVLQVHSLHLPTSPKGLVTLCDPVEARSAVRKAAELRVPFRVALPTYSCVVVFDAGGKVSEVFAEDLPANFPSSPDPYIVLDADAYLCGELVSEWRRKGPPELQAVIWYRLPVASDRLNWDWETLAKLCRGQTLRRGWSVEARQTPGLHHEIVVRNIGDAPDDLPQRVRLRAKEGMIAASDGLRGYTVEPQPDGSVSFRLAQPGIHARVPPGRELCVGWCRTTQDHAGVTAEVAPP